MNLPWIISLILALLMLYFLTYYLYLQPTYTLSRYIQLYLYIIDPFFYYIHKINPFSRNKKREIIICITIDGDLLEKKEISEIALSKCFRLLEKHKIKGKVTWFINELKDDWSKKYRKWLYKLKDEGYEIGYHDDYVYFQKKKGRNPSVEEIYGKYEKGINKLKEVIGKKEIISFRAGETCTTKELFEAIRKLGFRYDSSIVPERNLGDHFDYRKISIAEGVYFIDDGKKILEFPVTACPINHALLTNKKPFIVLVYFWHPCNFTKHGPGYETKETDWLFILKINYLLYSLRIMFPNAKWMTIREAGEYVLSKYKEELKIVDIFKSVK